MHYIHDSPKLIVLTNSIFSTSSPPNLLTLPIDCNMTCIIHRVTPGANSGMDGGKTQEWLLEGRIEIGKGVEDNSRIGMELWDGTQEWRVDGEMELKKNYL